MSRRFYKVLDTFEKVPGETTLPIRGTKKSCAYDFFAKTTYTAKPGETVKIWTDVKAEMEDDECLIINVRSSMAGKWELANTQGWIDADYFSNPKNDGNIGVFLTNICNEPLTIEKGDRIAQGKFEKYLITDDDNPLSEQREGGYGSTGK